MDSLTLERDPAPTTIDELGLDNSDKETTQTESSLEVQTPSEVALDTIEIIPVQNQLESSNIEVFEPEVSLNSGEDEKELEGDIDMSSYLEMTLNSDEVSLKENEVIDSEVSLEKELFYEVEGKDGEGEMHGEKRKFEDDETKEISEILLKLRPVKDLLRSDVYEEFDPRARNKNKKIHETLQDFFIRKNHSSYILPSGTPSTVPVSQLEERLLMTSQAQGNPYVMTQTHPNGNLSMQSQFRPHFLPPPSWNLRGFAPSTIHHRPTLGSSHTLHYRPPGSTLQKLKVIPQSALRPILSLSQGNQSIRPQSFSAPPGSPILQKFQAKSSLPNPQKTYNDPRLPEGWYLKGVIRQTGVSKGKFDFYIHGMNKRFRSVREIVRFYDLRSQTEEIEYIDYKVIEECIQTFRKQLMEQQKAQPDTKED